MACSESMAQRELPVNDVSRGIGTKFRMTRACVRCEVGHVHWHIKTVQYVALLLCL